MVLARGGNVNHSAGLFCQRLKGEQEVRGIFAHADDHEPIKTHAAKLANRRGRKVTPQPAACSTAG